MEDIILKKRIIGGFDRKQVIDCINTLMKECDNSVSPEQVKAAEDELSELEKLLKDKNEEINGLRQDKNKNIDINDINVTVAELERLLENSDESFDLLKNQLDEISLLTRELEDKTEIFSNRFDDMISGREKKQKEAKSTPKKRKNKTETAEKNINQLERDKMIEETAEKVKRLKREKELGKSKKKKSGD